MSTDDYDLGFQGQPGGTDLGTYDLGFQSQPGGTDLGQYDLGFQGREGTTELGQYDLGSEDLGHAIRSRSAENSLMHLQRESTAEADCALETELKQQGSSFVAALVHCCVVNR